MIIFNFIYIEECFTIKFDHSVRKNAEKIDVNFRRTGTLNHATETKDGWPPRSGRRVKLWIRQSVYRSWNERENQLGYGSRTHSEFAEILLHRVTISPPQFSRARRHKAS